jgi:hypothetical protein
MAISFVGIYPGSLQSHIYRKAQYQCLINLHLCGAMSLHLTGAGASLITKLMGSKNTLVLLYSARILLVQLVWVRGVTFTGWHLVK